LSSICHEETGRAQRFSSTQSVSGSSMEMKHSLQSCLFAPWERTPVPIGGDVGWAKEPVWTCLDIIKSSVPKGIRTPVRTARSLVLLLLRYRPTISIIRQTRSTQRDPHVQSRNKVQRTSDCHFDSVKLTTLILVYRLLLYAVKHAYIGT
jgi:hypothetical protein